MVARTDRPIPVLQAAYTGDALDPGPLLRVLQQRLPGYMVRTLLHLPELPSTPTARPTAPPCSPPWTPTGPPFRPPTVPALPAPSTPAAHPSRKEPVDVTATAITDTPARLPGRDEFCSAMAHLATGVAVITTAGPDGPVGCTANAVLSLSTEPPSLLVSLASAGRTVAHARDHGAFAVNILSWR